MNPHQKHQTSGSFSPISSLRDILYVLFRHKGKILFSAITGIVISTVLYFTSKPIYQSEAKVLLRYVRVESQPGNALGPAKIKSLDGRPESILNSELEILTSLDLAEQVADLVGVENIIGKGGNRALAAISIIRNISIEVPRKSNIIKVSFRHTNPQVAQNVLKQLIESYLKKHADVHRPVGIFDDFLSQQTDEHRSKLNKMDDELRSLRQKAGVVSIEESKKAVADQMAKIRQDLFAAEAELEATKSRQAELQKIASTKVAANASAPKDPVSGVPGSDQISRYRSLLAQLTSFHNQELLMSAKYTEENPQVQLIKRQIKLLEDLKLQLETENPGLRAMSTEPALAYTQPGEIIDPTKIPVLESRVKVLTSQLSKLLTEGTKYDELEVAMRQVQRTKDLAEMNYKYFSQNLEQSRIDETMGSDKITNISIVENASSPTLVSQALMKKLGMFLALGLFGGLAMAFFIEVVLDQTVKTDTQLAAKFGTPTLLAVPHFNLKSAKRLLSSRKGRNENGQPVNADLEPWAQSHPMRAYSEALRDRLVTYFHKRNMTHKPKLIGITSCSRGAGSTTIAAGLAATLSETGDGNVLLVDLNLPTGASLHPFSKGRLSIGLSDVLQDEKRPSACVQDNLYMATVQVEPGKNRVVLPKEMASFLPQLKASDYDYIIFDMPPVHQTSPTPRLAAMLDVVHLVVEAEKTQTEAVKRAKYLLSESEDSLTLILNKTRNYIPRWVEQPI